MAAKRTVDDRALNAHVWQRFGSAVRRMAADRSAACADAGLGGHRHNDRTALTADLLHNSEYFAIDSSAVNIDVAAERLGQRAAAGVVSRPVAPLGPGSGPAYVIDLAPAGTCTIRLSAADAFDYLESEAADADVLIAARLSRPGGRTANPRVHQPGARSGALLYTINFDGATILEPKIDPALDELIPQQYPRQWTVESWTASDPATAAPDVTSTTPCLTPVTVLAAGSSDWVVGPTRGGYPDDEAFFLHFIVDTISGALMDDPALDRAAFEKWITERHRQIDQHRLVFIAHQLDYLARRTQ